MAGDVSGRGNLWLLKGTHFLVNSRVEGGRRKVARLKVDMTFILLSGHQVVILHMHSLGRSTSEVRYRGPIL